MATAIDTGFMLDLLAGDPAAVAKARHLDRRALGTRRRDGIVLPAPVLYEVTAGILFARGEEAAEAFQGVAAELRLLGLEAPALVRAARLRAQLLRRGRPKAHTDVMVAGIAAHGGHVLLTRDQDWHELGRDLGLRVESY